MQALEEQGRHCCKSDLVATTYWGGAPCPCIHARTTLSRKPMGLSLPWRYTLSMSRTVGKSKYPSSPLALFKETSNLSFIISNSQTDLVEVILLKSLTDFIGWKAELPPRRSQSIDREKPTFLLTFLLEKPVEAWKVLTRPQPINQSRAADWMSICPMNYSYGTRQLSLAHTSMAELSLPFGRWWRNMLPHKEAVRPLFSAPISPLQAVFGLGRDHSRCGQATILSFNRFAEPGSILALLRTVD